MGRYSIAFRIFSFNIEVRILLHLLCLILEYHSCGRLKRVSFLLHWAQDLLDAIIHPLDVDSFSRILYLRTELEAVDVCTPGTLLNLGAGSSGNLHVVYTGSGFVCYLGIAHLLNE